MNHLESLIGEYLEWQGYLVIKNRMVGRLKRGGYAMELDVVGYHPGTGHLVHYEPSTDAHSWAQREQRFGKKFAMAREYILTEVFQWLPKDTAIEHIAVLPVHPAGRDTLANARLQSIDELVAEIVAKVKAQGIASRSAIGESFPLLRTIQLTVSGYNSAPKGHKHDHR